MNSLFDKYTEPMTPASNTTTSLAAAEQIQPNADALRKQVLDFIRSRGDRGATDFEIQESLGLEGNTERPRRWELSDDKRREPKIFNSGRTRPTPSGRKSIVWVATKGA